MIPDELKHLVDKPFQEIVEKVLEYSRKKHPNPIQSMRDGIAVIYGELKEAELAENYAEAIMELASVSAMCQRIFEDLNNV